MIPPPLKQFVEAEEGFWREEYLALFGLNAGNCCSCPFSRLRFSSGHDWSYSESPIVRVKLTVSSFLSLLSSHLSLCLSFSFTLPRLLSFAFSFSGLQASAVFSLSIQSAQNILNKIPPPSDQSGSTFSCCRTKERCIYVLQTSLVLLLQ